jgi:hypothetical protein
MPTAETDEGATGLSDAHQKLGDFISEVMHVRQSLKLVIDEGPEEFGVLLLTRQAARQLLKAAREYSQTATEEN